MLCTSILEPLLTSTGKGKLERQASTVTALETVDPLLDS